MKVTKKKYKDSKILRDRQVSKCSSGIFVVVQLLSQVWVFVTAWSCIYSRFTQESLPQEWPGPSVTWFCSSLPSLWPNGLPLCLGYQAHPQHSPRTKFQTFHHTNGSFIKAGRIPSRNTDSRASWWSQLQKWMRPSAHQPHCSYGFYSWVSQPWGHWHLGAG